MRKLIAGSVFFMALAGMTVPVQAVSEGGEPQKMVSDATQRALAALQANKSRLQKEPQYLETIINEHVLPYMDFTAMSKLVLGQAWKNASDVQRSGFTEQFKALLVRTYTRSLREYSHEVIEFLPFRRSDQSNKTAMVKSRIKRGSGSHIDMEYRLRFKDADGWKIFDINIEGVSLVTNYRNSFSREISQQGIDHLIASLKQQNQKSTSGSAAEKS